MTEIESLRAELAKARAHIEHLENERLYASVGSRAALEAKDKALRLAATALGNAHSAMSHAWASDLPPRLEDVNDADAAEDAARAALSLKAEQLNEGRGAQLEQENTRLEQEGKAARDLAARWKEHAAQRDSENTRLKEWHDNAAREAEYRLAENTRLLEALRQTVAINYLRPCVGCDKSTWWRERGTGAPRCLKCVSPESADMVNVCPQRLREYLPPYAAPLSGEQSQATEEKP